MSKIKNPVLTLLPNKFLAGVESVVTDLYEEFNRRNQRSFRIVWFDDQNGDGESKIRENCYYFNDDQRLDCILKGLTNFVGYAPILLVNGIGLDLGLGCYLRKQGCRIVYVLQGDSPYYYDSAVHYSPIIDTYIAISSNIEKKLRERIGTSKKIVPVFEGVKVPDIFKENKSSDIIRIVYAGRIECKQKAMERSIPFIENLEKENTAYYWTVIGDGLYLTTMKQRIKEIGAGQHVEFSGIIPRSRWIESLANQDVFLLFSKFEGLSVAMLEAMAHGVVPIVTETSGADDVISDGKNGFIISQDKLHEMADRVIFLKNNPDLRKTMSRAAWQTIRDRFSLQKITDRYEEIFSDLDAEGPWSGTVPNLVCRRDIFDLPVIPNNLAIFARMLKRKLFTKNKN